MPKESSEDLKEMRAAKKLQAEQKRRQTKYDHVEREVRYGLQTMARHEKSWREMLMAMALPKMRSELEYAWHNHERAVDAKDFTISLLMDELQESRDQYSRNICSHTDNIDKLIILCYDQIQDLRTDSRNVIHNLYQAATFERTDVSNITRGNEEYLKTMLFILDSAKKESEKLIRGEYLSKQEVEMSRLTDLCTKFTEELELKYGRTWRETNAFLRAHISNCAVRRRQFTRLNEQDEKMQRLIAGQWESIRRHLETIKTMRSGFDDLQAVQSRKIVELTGERNHFQGVFTMAKRFLEEERLLDEKNLTLLTLESNAVIDNLGTLERKGEKLLKLSAICRKFETIEEKTMAFPMYGRTHNPADLCEAYRPEILMFFNRVAQAECSRYQMLEEIEYLKLENQALREKIHGYCQCFSCEVQR